LETKTKRKEVAVRATTFLGMQGKGSRDSRYLSQKEGEKAQKDIFRVTTDEINGSCAEAKKTKSSIRWTG